MIHHPYRFDGRVETALEAVSVFAKDQLVLPLGFAKDREPMECEAEAAGFRRETVAWLHCSVQSLSTDPILYTRGSCASLRRPPPVGRLAMDLVIWPTWAALTRCTSRSPIGSVCTFQLWSVKKLPMHRLVEAYELPWPQRSRRGRQILSGSERSASSDHRYPKTLFGSPTTGRAMPQRINHCNGICYVFPDDFGGTLVRLREALGLPWAEIARRLRADPSTLRRLHKRGGRPNAHYL